MLRHVIRRGAWIQPGQSLAGLMLLCLIVAGLFTMHGVQPTPGPTQMPSVILAGVGEAGMPPNAGGSHDAQMPSHGGHDGGEVCLALLAASTLLLLVAMASWTAFASRAEPSHRFVPRSAPMARGPTLALLCVLRR